MNVLMVTGAYSPEISSGGLQSETMAGALRGRAEVRVLTTAIDPATPRRSRVDGIEVTRIHVRMGHPLWQLRALCIMAAELIRLVRWCDVVHVHGVSNKNVVVAAVARLVGRPVVVSLHTMGPDTPEAIKRTGALAWWAFNSASRYLAVSPALMRAALDAGIDARRIEHLPNGIDIDRFTPASADERRALRRSLNIDIDVPVVVFVGYFSHDKQPRVLFDAWMRLRDEHGIDATVCFVGAHDSPYFEVDTSIADGMRRDAVSGGRAGRLILTGPVHDVQRYLRLADLFVLPSRREGLPVALMEAMACGLPCVASQLPGATDVLIDNGVSGVLVPVGDVAAFAAAIASILKDAPRAAELGTAARQVIFGRFARATIAERWLACYDGLVGGARRSA